MRFLQHSSYIGGLPDTYSGYCIRLSLLVAVYIVKLWLESYKIVFGLVIRLCFFIVQQSEKICQVLCINLLKSWYVTHESNFLVIRKWY